MSRRPTLSDVAREAGVSVSTASLAFSGAGPIAEQTRERVHAAAATLGYAGPNALGRQLRSGRHGIVGVVIGDKVKRSFRDPVSIQMLDGLVSTLSELRLGVMLIPGMESDEMGAMKVDPLLETSGMDVAVLIWGAHVDDPRLEVLRRRSIPVVIGEGNAAPGCSLVAIDDRGGFAELAEHLYGLGHRRVANVTLPFRMGRKAGWIENPRDEEIDWTPTRNRLEALEESRLEVVATYETPASLVESGADAARLILDPARWPDPAKRPTAIVAQSDLLAAGVVLAAREMGLRVPEDVSVVGFDGVDLPWLGTDSLTTVTQPLEAKGEALGHAVDALLQGRGVTEVVLPVELRVGTTTGPPPAL